MQTVALTPARVESLLSAIGKERASDAPAPGKWSAREIVAHLADCELVFAFRMRQTLAVESPTVQPFDQEKWAEVYGAYDALSAMETFSALRYWNLAFLRSLKPEDLQRKMTHPERGTMTLQTVIETIGGHDLNHIGQLERIAGAAAAG
jgi:uncharacterized damage-inducible protein DinB